MYNFAFFNLFFLVLLAVCLIFTIAALLQWFWNIAIQDNFGLKQINY